MSAIVAVDGSSTRFRPHFIFDIIFNFCEVVFFGLVLKSIDLPLTCSVHLSRASNLLAEDNKALPKVGRISASTYAAH
jgi:hypothetical protein